MLGLGILPTADVGTAAWWIQKLPMFGIALVILVGIVAKVAKVEQKALLAPRMPWNGGMPSLFAAAAALSFTLKFWANGSITMATICIAVLIGLWHGVLKTKAA